MKMARYEYREPATGQPLTPKQAKSWGIIIKAFRTYKRRCITYDEIMHVWRESQDIRVKYTTLDRHIRKFMEDGLLERETSSRRKTIICLPDRVYRYYFT